MTTNATDNIPLTFENIREKLLEPIKLLNKFPSRENLLNLRNIFWSFIKHKDKYDPLFSSVFKWILCEIEDLILEDTPFFLENPELVSSLRSCLAYMTTYNNPSWLKILFDTGMYGSKTDLTYTSQMDHPIISELLQQFDINTCVSKDELESNVAKDVLNLMRSIATSNPGFFIPRDKYGFYPFQRINLLNKLFKMAERDIDCNYPLWLSPIFYHWDKCGAEYKGYIDYLRELATIVHYPLISIAYTNKKIDITELREMKIVMEGIVYHLRSIIFDRNRAINELNKLNKMKTNGSYEECQIRYQEKVVDHLTHWVNNRASKECFIQLFENFVGVFRDAKKIENGMLSIINSQTIPKCISDINYNEPDIDLQEAKTCLNNYYLIKNQLQRLSADDHNTIETSWNEVFLKL